MAFSSGFFNAKNMDRVYSAEDFTGYLSSLICNGILDTYGQCFAMSAHTGQTIKIGTGKAWINGHYFNSDTEYILDLSPYVDASLNKYVLIGICCDTSEDVRTCSIVTIESLGAQNPVIPSFIGSATKTYLTLAAVYLSASTASIDESDIIDYREDDSKCGYVKCILGKCGVTELQTQLNDLFQEAYKQIDAIIKFNKDEFASLQKRMSTAEKKLGIYVAAYPDVNGDGIVNASDAAIILDFAAEVGAGNYTNDILGWQSYAQKNNLNTEVYPDVNGDNIVNASDATIIFEFAAEVGAGNYTSDVEGWNSFISNKYPKPIYGDGVQQITVLTQEEYKTLPTPDNSTLYAIKRDETGDDDI